MNRNLCYLFLMIMDSWRHEKSLSYKLRCYKRISSPVKSRYNTREKIPYFFHVFDIANQLLTRHSPFAPLGQVDERTVKPTRFPIQGRLSKFFRIMAAKTLKNLYRSQAVTLELSQKRKKTNAKYGTKKPKVTYSVALVMAFSRLRTKQLN